MGKLVLIKWQRYPGRSNQIIQEQKNVTAVGISIQQNNVLPWAKPVSVVGDETIFQIAVKIRGNHRSIHCWPHQKNRNCAMLDFLNLRR